MLNRHTTMWIILTGALSLVVLSACSTRKHAAVMGGEGAGSEAGTFVTEKMRQGADGKAVPMQPMTQENLQGASKEGLPGQPVAPTQMASPEQPARVQTPAQPASSVTTPSGVTEASAPSLPPTPNLEGAGFDIASVGGASSSPGGTTGSGSPANVSPQRGLDLGKAGEKGSSQLTFSPSGANISGGESMAPTSGEGTEFARAISPSDFVPDMPPQPRLPRQDAPSGGTGSKGMMSDVGETAASHAREEEELVKVPMQPSDIEPLGRMPQGRRGADGRQDTALGHVYFDFDKFNIRPDAADTLAENAQLLRSDLEDATILIEGHCDERGTNEYNMVLGERRAHAAKEYLVNLGVSSSRINTMSYGEEKPFCTSHEPDCWQENRQGHFVLQ